MSTVHGLSCNSCRALLIFTSERGIKAPTKAALERTARDRGWNAPDKMGRHWCPECRRPDGRKRET